MLFCAKLCLPLADNKELVQEGALHKAKMLHIKVWREPTRIYKISTFYILKLFYFCIYLLCCCKTFSLLCG